MHNFDDFPPDHPAHKLANTISRVGQFAPKLTLDEQCEIAALRERGVSLNILALAYDVHRRTVVLISKVDGPGYPGVKKERARLGPALFVRTYVTEAAVAKVQRVKEARLQDALSLSAKEVKAIQDGSGEPRKRANQKAGISLIRGSMCSYEHRVEIQWHEGDSATPTTWQWRDLDTDPDTWNWGIRETTDEGFKYRATRTSTEAYEDAKANIFDDGAA